jgi:hypothetical protein
VKISWPKRYLVVLVLAGCSSKPATSAPPHRDGGSVPFADAATPVVQVPATPLGLGDFEAWQWRKRAGQPAFRTARKAEARGDWAGVATACKEALAADPTHLEASWLIAVANAKLGRLDAIAAPLALAGDGDYTKWALQSLEQPALQPFLATPAGAAWKTHVADVRAKYLEAISHGMIAIARGDLYSISHDRWYRLTRTFGGVVGAYINGHRIAYVTRKKSAQLAIGSVDLDTGMTTKPQDLAGSATQIAFTDKEHGFWIGQGAVKRVLILADTPQQGLLASTKLARPSGAWAELSATGSVRIHRTPIANISADFDDYGLASAIKIAASNRVVTVKGQIAGDTIAWAPDHNHLALIAQISDTCDAGPSVAAYIVDAATGAATEVARPSRRGGMAIDWIDDRTIAIASEDGVVTQSLGAQPQLVTGAQNLLRPRFSAHCETPPPDDSEPPDPDDATPEN